MAKSALALWQMDQSHYLLCATIKMFTPTYTCTVKVLLVCFCFATYKPYVYFSYFNLLDLAVVIVTCILTVH